MGDPELRTNPIPICMDEPDAANKRMPKVSVGARRYAVEERMHDRAA